MRKNTKQLTEEQLRQYIKESVHQQLNEYNKYIKLWNNLKNKFRGRKNNSNTESEEEPDYYNPNYEINDDNNTDDWYTLTDYDESAPNQSEDNHIEPENNNEGEYESYPQFDPYEQQQDFNNTPLYQEGEPQEQGETPVEQPVEAATAQPEEAPQEAAQEEPQEAEPEPQQPAYQRKGDDGRVYSENNEKVITDYIKPAYNTITQAYKALYNLQQLGPDKYNDVALLQGAHDDYKNMIQQINQIWPTMRYIRTNMKQIMYKNGIRNKADYEHYGLEEQKLRKIISRSVSKILKEHHIY